MEKMCRDEEEEEKKKKEKEDEENLRDQVVEAWLVKHKVHVARPIGMSL